MTSCTLLTAVYDGYDSLKPVPAQTMTCEQVCVTDDPALETPGWRTIVEPRPDVHPNLAAKRPKCLPWEYVDSEYVIWIDASLRIVSQTFVSDMLTNYLPLGQYAHPDRDCIYDEATVSAEMGKYSGLPLFLQTGSYTAEHPRHWGLWATGVIIRQRTPEIETFGRAWLAECEQWGFQDQVSQAVVLRRHGLRPVPIDGRCYTNSWTQYEGSTRH